MKSFKNTKMELACPHAGGVLQEALKNSGFTNIELSDISGVNKKK